MIWSNTPLILHKKRSSQNKNKIYLTLSSFDQFCDFFMCVFFYYFVISGRIDNWTILVALDSIICFPYIVDFFITQKLSFFRKLKGNFNLRNHKILQYRILLFEKNFNLLGIYRLWHIFIYRIKTCPI